MSSRIDDLMSKIEARTDSLAEGQQDGGFFYSSKDPEEVARLYFNGYIMDPEIVDEILDAIQVATVNGSKSMLKASLSGGSPVGTLKVLLCQVAVLGIMAGREFD